MWLGRVFCVFAVGCALAQAEDGNSRTVVTQQGKIRGYKDPEGGLFTFLNIPYATAPTGKDKFKAPLPAPVWTSTREAVDRGVICPQMDLTIFLIVNKTVQEDCLIANVYVPDTDEKNLPVVVYVHGGAYLMGFGNSVTPKHMVRTKNVIYVTFNYRLGVQGFLCLGTPDAPGNAGMKDMVALLHWVKSNIANFGGNPDDVTIEGSSAGSSAVDLLLLSKSAKGLFHKAIPESGANVAMWSVQVDPIDNAKEFAKSYHGFENIDDIYALEEFYKTLPYDVMYKAGIDLMIKTRNNFLFTPCVERDTGVEKFLNDAPVNILKKGDYYKAPVLYGFANMEGLFRIDFGYDHIMGEINEKFSEYLPHDLQFKDEEEKKIVADEVKKFYFGDKKINNDTILEYIDYFTDVMYAYPHLRSLKLQVEAGNDQIYLYQFSYPFEYSAPEGVKVKLIGSNHAAQTAAVMDSMEEKELPSEVLKIKSIVRQFWFNFIKTGKPVPAGSDLPAWPAAGRTGSPHMEITNNPQLLDELLTERMRLWDDIYARYYRAPMAPPAPPTQPSSSFRIEPALGMVASILFLWFL